VHAADRAGARLRDRDDRQASLAHSMLAELMLPDGAHARAEDWTTFFLKHPPTARVAEAQEEVAAQSKGGETGGSAPSITHVLNLVRTKHDNSVRR